MTILDQLSPTNGNDVLTGGAGSDLLNGGNGDDTLSGAGGNDTLLGGNGNDTLSGGEGSDSLSGGNGNDTLLGGTGSDVLLGENGDDTLDGGAGADTVSGGAGNDLLIYTQSENVGSYDIYDGGKGQDTLRLIVSAAVYGSAAFQADLALLQSKLAQGSATLYLSSIDLLVSSIERLELIVQGGNRAPTPVGDSRNATEDTALVIAAASLLANDTDPDGDPLTIVSVGGAQNGTVVFDGTNIVFSAAENYSGTASFSYTVRDSAGNEATATVTIAVAAVADTPTLVTSAASGSEDKGAIPLSISASLTDASEVLSVVISGVPAGATLNHGQSDGNGNWVLTAPDLDGLTLTPAENFSGEITLTVTATSAEANGSTASATSNLAISVAGVADAPSIVAQPATGAAGAPVPVHISVDLTDPSETIEFIEVRGVPDSFRLNAGTALDSGGWLLSPSDLVGLALVPANPAAAAFGSFTLQVTVASLDGTDRETSSAAIAVTIAPPANTLTGRAVDGYIAGATVFADADGDGTLDFGEVFTTTAADGTFTLTGGSGTLVMFGGMDVSTGQAFAGVMRAPEGSTVVTPLTTLISALIDSTANDLVPLDVETAQALLASALGLPPVELTTFDPIAEVQAGNATAASILGAAVQVQTTVTQIAAAVGGGEAVVSVVGALTGLILQGGTVDLTSTTTLTDIVTASVPAGTDAGAIDAVSAVVAAANTSIENSLVGSGVDLLTAVAQSAQVALGDTTTALSAAGLEAGNLTSVVTNYTGAALDSAVQAAPVGDVDGPLIGTIGADVLIGTAGADAIEGLASYDILDGKGGNDLLYGGDGNDRLIGGSGDDLLDGGWGFDTLSGGVGNDTVTGGSGADRFIYSTGDGSDVVTDFNRFENDRIDLRGVVGISSFADVLAAASQVGANTVLDFGAGDRLTLANVSLVDLSTVNFIVNVPARVGEYLPDDPLFADQWQLRNIGQSGFGSGDLDLKVTYVWPDYTGAGVSIGVFDNGVDYNHPDLNDNYDASLNAIINGVVSDANWLAPNLVGGTTGFNAFNAHGTGMAGIAAAENDGVGIVGVAYDASITGVYAPILGKNTPSTELVQAFQQIDNFDVAFFASGGASFRDGALATGWTDIHSALANATSVGRDGLGTVILNSVHNDGPSAGSFDTNASQWDSTRFAIHVGGVTDEGVVAPNATRSAAMHVSGFTSMVPPGEFLRGIWATDISGADGYTSGDYGSGGGTTSAVSQVAGVTALMLEANAELGWRDVQSILVDSARHVGSAIGSGPNPLITETDGWEFNGAETWNGGGRHFSNDYGYGVVDALAAVRLAETWHIGATAATSSNEAIGSATISPISQAIPDNATGSVTLTFNVTQNISIEAAQLRLGFNHARAQDLQILLTSPDGTESMILHPIADGNSSVTGNGWRFVSQEFRGEMSAGVWTATIIDTVAGNVGSLVGNSSLVVFGASNTADDRYVYTNEYSAYGSADGRNILADTDGGTDTINAAAVTVGSTINLNAGAASNIAGQGLTIAAGSVIENAVGGDGDDILTGNTAANILYGGRGADRLNGGAGNDTLTGGTGADTFVYSHGSGSDLITDLNLPQGDRIDLTGLPGFTNFDAVQAAASQIGGDTVIDFGGGDTLTLAGVDLAGLNASHFIFGTNSAPTDISLSNASVIENAAGAVIGVLGITDPDAGDTATYTVDDARFEVVGGALKLKDGVALDFEAGSSVTVAVTATDAGGLSIAQSFTLSVTNANEAPTDISLSNASVSENAAGAVIGVLGVTDPDAGDTATYTVDDARFEVVGGALKLKDGVALDFEAGSTVTVAVTATDAGGLSVAQSFTLSVTNANEAPTALSLSNASVAENAAGAVIGVLGITDPDAGDTATYTVDDARFEVVGGALKLKDGVALDFEAGSSVTVAVTATDAGGLSIAQSFTLSVTDANEAPTDISLSNASVTENAAGGTVVGSLLLIDPDASETATFTLLDSAGGRFASNGGTIVVAGAIDYEAATSHSVTVRATDSAGNAVTKTFTISVADVVETSIVGTVGNDTLIGTVAADEIRALAGDDNITGGNGDDLIDGGEGLDRAIYVDASGGVSISLASGAAAGPGNVGNDTLMSIEFIRGSEFNDTFDASGFGASSANAGSLSYRNLDGTLNEFEGMGGDDSIVGNGSTRLSYLNATNGVTVDLFAGTAMGGASAGNDTFSGVNTVRGSNFADTLLGSGNGAGTVEVFDGRGGADTIDGRGGFDRSNYEFEAGAITVNLAAGTVNNGGVIDTIRSIESIRGTAGVDTYSATGFTETSINAGSAGINGAGAAFNEFEGMGGNDNITGNGNTRVSYQNASAGVIITFAAGGAGTASGDASVGSDTFAGGVFNARGSQFGDTLTGAGGNDTLDGQGGNDVINGGGGNDTLIGGSGDDTLNGGAGFDVAVFSGSRSAYTFATGTVSGIDGNDTTTGGIELLRFDDAYMLWADAVNVVGVNLAAGLGIFGRSVADDLTVDNAMNGRLINLGAGEDTIRISMGGGTPQSIELNTANVENIVMAGTNTGSLVVTMTAGTVLNGTTVDLGSFSDGLNLSDGNDVVTIIGVETINAGGGNDIVTLVGDGTSPYTVNLGGSNGLDVLNLAGTSSNFSLSLSGGTVLVNGQTTGAAGGNENVTLSNEQSDTTFDLGAGYDTLLLFSVNGNDIRVRNVEEVSAIGFGGDTVINEGAGTTTFTLGGGADHVYAGAGVDRIRFTTVGDSVFEVPDPVWPHNMDQVTHFDAGQDVFVFQGVGGTSFNWDIATYTVESAFTVGVNQPPIMVDIDILRIDLNGDASGDFGWDMGIEVTGMNGTFTGANIQWLL